MACTRKVLCCTNKAANKPMQLFDLRAHVSEVMKKSYSFNDDDDDDAPDVLAHQLPAPPQYVCNSSRRVTASGVCLCFASYL